MPAITTTGSLSAQSLGGVGGTSALDGTYGSRRRVRGSTPTFVFPPSTVTVSPAIGGLTTVDLTSVTLSTCGTWTVTPTEGFFANVQMWGAGGGGAYKYSTAPDLYGGNGGYSRAIVEFKVGNSYQFIVGCPGSAGSGTRPGGGGGGATGIQIVSGSVAVLVAGGGGGAGSSGGYNTKGGDGGGTTGVSGSVGSNQYYGGGGGTQSVAGGGGSGTRRTGSSGLGRSGGAGASGGSSGTGGGGGAGFGTGGSGGVGGTDDGSGGGGGGYFGGGGGGGSEDGGGGGGGSGYYNPAHASGGVLTQGYGTTSDRGTAGAGGVAGSGTAGKILIKAHA